MPDLRQAVEVLRRQLRLFHVKIDVDFHAMIMGSYLPFTDLYRHLLGDYDPEITAFLLSNNFLLSETEDKRFMETLYRICRDVLDMKPIISLAQFFTKSFPEKKLQMAADIIKALGVLQKDLGRNHPVSSSSLARITSVRPGALRQTAQTSARPHVAGPPQCTSPSSFEAPAAKPQRRYHPLYEERVQVTEVERNTAAAGPRITSVSQATAKHSDEWGSMRAARQPTPPQPVAMSLIPPPQPGPVPRHSLRNRPRHRVAMEFRRGKAEHGGNSVMTEDDATESLSTADISQQGDMQCMKQTDSVSNKPVRPTTETAAPAEKAPSLPDLTTTLNVISSQLSVLVNRMAGIETRVSAMEHPVAPPSLVSNGFSAPTPTGSTTIVLGGGGSNQLDPHSKNPAVTSAVTANTLQLTTDVLPGFVNNLAALANQLPGLVNRVASIESRVECVQRLNPQAEDTASYTTPTSVNQQPPVETRPPRALTTQTSDTCPPNDELDADDYAEQPNDRTQEPHEENIQLCPDDAAAAPEAGFSSLTRNLSEEGSLASANFPVHGPPQTSMHQRDTFALECERRGPQSAHSATCQPTVLRQAFAQPVARNCNYGDCGDDLVGKMNERLNHMPAVNSKPTANISPPPTEYHNTNASNRHWQGDNATEKKARGSRTVTFEQPARIMRVSSVERLCRKELESECSQQDNDDFKQQVNRISNMLNETQRLLSSRRPLPLEQMRAAITRECNQRLLTATRNLHD